MRMHTHAYTQKHKQKHTQTIQKHTYTQTHTHARMYKLTQTYIEMYTDLLVVESALIWLKLSLMFAQFHSRSCGRSGGALSINGTMAFAIVLIHSS